MHEYKSRVLGYYIMIVIIASGCSTDKGMDETSVDEMLFRFVPQSHSGITFSNDLTADMNTKFNLFDFDYFYNGAGVGIEDINNDGLQDIFFCSNQGDNKLYLNKGKLQFEDISDKAGINANKKWSNGVTFCDINQDGWMDIYVSQGGPHEHHNRPNLLYINNGNLTFSESAAEYGLDDKGISTQSAFADFDGDGDLDCIVMNEAEAYGFGVNDFFSIVSKSEASLMRNSSQMYINEQGRYINQTKESGLLTPSFGLGLVVTDLNQDGALDIYMANDYYIPDAMYINNGKGVFRNQIKQKTKQISFFGMGVDANDINNDGRQDLYVLDMASRDHYRSKTLMASMNTSAFDYLTKTLSFPYQYMFNSLLIADGHNGYNNVSQLCGLANTDWSWAGLIADFDYDGLKDIYVTNGYRKYALDNDFKNKVTAEKKKYNNQVPIDIKQRLYDEMPEEKLSNILYAQESLSDFNDITNSSGLSAPSYSNGATYGDLDNDGDIDLVVNNIDQTAFLIENKSSDSKQRNYINIVHPKTESYSNVAIYYNGKMQYGELNRVRGYMSACQPILSFGIGENNLIDSIVVTDISNKSSSILTNLKANQTIDLSKIKSGNTKNHKIQNDKYVERKSLGTIKLFGKHTENDYNDFAEEILLPYKQSTIGPKISRSTNNQGSTYIFMPGATGQPSKIFKTEGSHLKNLPCEDMNADKLSEDIRGEFFDLENDGDLDLFVVSGGNSRGAGNQLYQNKLYINDGNDAYEKSADFLSDAYSSGTCISIDIDKDGYQDILVGNRIVPQKYPLAAPSFFYKNESGHLTDRTDDYMPELKDFGIINDVVATDFNGDSWTDVIAVAEWGEIGFFENQQGKLKLVHIPQTKNLKGWWYSITETDINNDNLQDYVIGNLGLNSKYTADQEKPFRVHAHDFDDTGTLDIVLSKKYKDDYVPLRGRECSSDQMPFIKEKFPSYDLFAKASIEEVYTNLDDAYTKEVNEFRSLLLVNEGSGQFALQYLPIEAQSLPILDGLSVDINKDGYKDVIICGNIYNTEVETPRLDYTQGIILFSDGNRLTTRTDGLIPLGDNVKSVIDFQIGDGDYLLFGVNDNIPKLFSY